MLSSFGGDAEQEGDNNKMYKVGEVLFTSKTEDTKAETTTHS